MQMGLREQVIEATGSDPSRCYQCVKCSAGCPLAEEFDFAPNQVMRCIQLEDEAVLESRAIWLCASCQTCSTRCPQEIDVTGVMDVLRIESRKRGIPPAVPEIARFNTLFMRSVKRFGRAWEVGLAGAFNLASRKPFKDFRMGLRMFRRGKLKFLPHRASGNHVPQRRQYEANAIAYYPGCSLNATAVEYGKSVRNIAGALDLDLVEPPDWVCCGSSPAHATDPERANVLPMKTIAAVEQMGLDTLTSPCSACYSRFKHAEHATRRRDSVRETVGRALGYEYGGTVNISHLLDIIVDRVGLEAVGRRVSHPLRGMKVACYYGCLITRPSRVTDAEHPEYPVKMDRLMGVLGAETVEWSRKTDCCGASLGISKPESALGLIRRILDDAIACGAEAVVTMCPVCHLNLDARQDDLGYEKPLPVFQATQLMALAFGQGPRGAAIRHNLVDTRPCLVQKGLLS
jgi:heterodisulfide reductase subunit B